MNTNQTELKMEAPAPELTTRLVCEWHPASEPPKADAAGIRCVSVPKEGLHHTLATWNGKEWKSIMEDEGVLEGVTFWCDLPLSPEYMAAHPDAFEDDPESKAD